MCLSVFYECVCSKRERPKDESVGDESECSTENSVCQRSSRRSNLRDARPSRVLVTKTTTMTAELDLSKRSPTEKGKRVDALREPSRGACSSRMLSYSRVGDSLL